MAKKKAAGATPPSNPPPTDPDLNIPDAGSEPSEAAGAELPAALKRRSIAARAAAQKKEFKLPDDAPNALKRRMAKS